MATYSNITTKHATLVAATVDTLTFASAVSPTIINRSTAGTIYARVDGSTPTSGGDGTIVITAGAVWRSHVPTVTVKLISATADAYSVQGES